MRCPECGAHNAVDAAWCGQCFAQLREAEAPAPAAEEQAAPAAPPARAPGSVEDRPLASVEGLAARPLQVPGEVGGAPPPPPPAPADRPLPPPPPLPGVDPALQPTEQEREQAELLGGGTFRRTAAGLEWACATCAEWNVLERTSCRVCGAAFGAGPDAAAAPPPDVPEVTLAVASVLAPGAGHALLGRRGEAVVRLLLALTWSVGGIVLLRGSLASGRSVLPAVPLLLGWLVLAVTCTNDALVHGGTKGTVLLQPRLLLWLVVGVVGATAVAALLQLTALTGG